MSLELRSDAQTLPGFPGVNSEAIPTTVTGQVQVS